MKDNDIDDKTENDPDFERISNSQLKWLPNIMLFINQFTPHDFVT